VPAARKRWRRRLRRAVVAVALIVAVIAALTARLFVFPAQGLPPHVDALVMLDGPGDSARLATALRLAREHRAPALLISQGTWMSQPGQHCPASMPGVRVICFNPTPATTRGEAEFIGRFARQHRWKSLALVTVAPQDTRARLRIGRCFPGQIYALTAPLPAGQWPYEIAYEWGATLKALFLQRNC
jgi:uncharacterized SAM-binding protein YcdF (DUF218 family)